MASSPTSSSYSTYSSPFVSSSSSSASATSSNFSGLPIMSLREKIVDKVMENRVTLIVGETGCGKSSQVPQFLLEENIEPILCTQPRRFAVVAVAKMVARARNCAVGGEVGYHIGHSRVISARSKIIFKTAGVLLDEMREKGVGALKYKVIILDEVHERSVESDLVLVCVKQFLLKNTGLRVVLMSATADISRYREYFKDLGRDERVEVLGIPSSSQHTLYQRRVLYLEQVAELLGMSSENFSAKYCSGSSPLSAEADIKDEVHTLIHNLVLHIHKNEPDMEKSILIFLPTYHSLEQQWFFLKRFSSDFKVHILHSSIDTEQALSAMRIWKSHRKVILATNIAESSVTIPKVAYVIDSCRSLQVYWDGIRRKDSSELTWVSESQAEQRRGRTGRTCDGQVYRLVTESFFGQLEKYEQPAILRLSLRQQVLLICCAESKVISDPKVLMQKALDPPKAEVVEDALHLLAQIHALEKTSSRGRYEPTFYGRLLASFSLSFDASTLILKFADKGMLREGILIGVLMDTQPLPILRPFGQELLFAEYTDSYFNGDSKITGLTGRKEVTLMGNLRAFQFWQRTFKDKHRLERLKQLLKLDETKDAQAMLPKIEEEWCSFHNLVQSSLHHVADIYEDILNSLHRYRPQILANSDGRPSYYDPYEFQHTCLLKFEQNEEYYDRLASEEERNAACRIGKCLALPFVGSDHFQMNEVARRFATSIKETMIQYTQDISGQRDSVNGGDSDDAVEQCIYFASGSCNKGSECHFSHSFQAKRPACKFFFSLKGCRNGASCIYSHDMAPSAASHNRSIVCPAEDSKADAVSLLRLLPASSDGCVLLLDDIDFRFSSHLARHYDPSSIITTTSSVIDSASLNPSVKGLRILWGLSDPYQTIISKAGESTIPWNEVKRVLWFPKFDGDSDDWEAQKSLIRTLFDYLAVRILADGLYELQVILAMNNLRFAQLQVEKLVRDSFFFLQECFPFDESSFGELFDSVTSKKPLLVSKSVTYVFNLHPPTDIQFGDYTAVVCQNLHNR